MSKAKHEALVVGDRVRYEATFRGIGRGSGMTAYRTNATVAAVDGDRFDLVRSDGTRLTGVHRARLTKLAPVRRCSDPDCTHYGKPLGDPDGWTCPGTSRVNAPRSA